MKKTKDLYIEMYRENKGLFFAMIGLVVVGIFSAILMVLNLKPGGSVVKVLYSDLVGYRDGGWREMLFFPLNSLIFSIISPFLIGRAYKEKGEVFAKTIFAVMVALIMISILVFFRLSGEK